MKEAHRRKEEFLDVVDGSKNIRLYGANVAVFDLSQASSNCDAVCWAQWDRILARNKEKVVNKRTIKRLKEKTYQLQTAHLTLLMNSRHVCLVI